MAVVTGVTAVGVTYTHWEQANTQAAQERARDLYCTANPFDEVCAGRVPDVLYDLKGTFVNNSLHAPGGCGTTWTWYANGLPGPIDQKYFNWDYPNLGTWGFFSWGYFHGTLYSKYMVIQDSTNYYIGASADKCIGGSGNYGTNLLNIVSVQRSDGKDGTATHPLVNWQD